MALAPAFVLGAIVGIGPFFDAFYASSTWQPATLLALLALSAAVVSVRSFPTGWGLVSLAALTALLALGALSMTWAESVDRAWLESGRLVLYVAFFGLALFAIRDRRQGLAAMTAITAGAAAVVIATEVTLFSDSAPGQFSGFRLNEPIGYVNGVAGCLLIGTWMFVGLAERFRSWWAQAVLMGLATMGGCLLVLTQSRAVMPAIAVSIVCCLVPVGRLRRAWFLTFVLAGIALASPRLLDVFAQEHLKETLLPRPDSVHPAATAALFASIGTAAAWGLACAVASWVGISRQVRAAAAATLVVLVVTAVAAAFAFEDPVGRIDRAAHDFLELKVDPTATERFTSGGGYRADLWRIAWDQFERKPLTGIGLGNYELPFVIERHHQQYVKQPHSLEMQMLAELGIFGLVALALFVAGVYAAAWRARRADPAERAVLVAGLGAFTVWLTHTSMDWLYNLPAITGMALLAAAAVAGLGRRPARALSHRSDRVTRLLAVCAVALAAAAVGRHWVADLYRESGQRALAHHPVRALEQASASLQLNPDSLETDYLAAAAYARIGRYDAARVTLLKATRLEPSRYVPWALLGDLAVRKGRLSEAKRYYARAAELNPLEKSLKDLARHPSTALK
jgi:O-antigen ligase